MNDVFMTKVVRTQQDAEMWQAELNHNYDNVRFYTTPESGCVRCFAIFDMKDEDRT